MKNYVENKSILITGAGSGFGRLVAQKAVSLGASVTCVDINKDTLKGTADLLADNKDNVLTVVADVAKAADMKRAAAESIAAFGKIDVILNNAGIMPLAFYADHEAALERWHDCIDINFKGVLNGIACVFDHMMSRGQGHVINMSSIFGNYPVAGSNVYAATKAAVNFLSESLRVEAHGKIKVTTIRPTGVLSTGLAQSMINPAAAVGISGHNGESHGALMMQLMEGTLDPQYLDAEQGAYMSLDPEYIADQIIHVINQPQGVSLGDVTIRATGDQYIL